ncbi:creatininase family protein [Catellatospora sp. NPDC049609]|uniref:creatininase family protein n=1 Tax=Catellatospora sp. NPDC049609 TaxID=3155505 RepID=UPI00342EB9C5
MTTPNLPIDLARLNWMGVAQRLSRDVRIVIPMGATEEHGYLSLASDTIFADYVTGRACAAADVTRTPVIPFGPSAFGIHFPGTLSMRTSTMCAVVEDIIDCLYRQGFRRLVFATGHGGNEVVTAVLSEAQLDRDRLSVYYYNCWDGMREESRRISTERGFGICDHAAWYEVQRDTRVGPIPSNGRQPVPSDPDFPMFPLNPRTARQHLPDGVVSGPYDIGDDDLTAQLREGCVKHFEAFLRSLPPTEPAS